MPKGCGLTIIICGLLFLGLCLYIENNQPQYYYTPPPTPERTATRGGPLPVGLVLVPVGLFVLPAIIRYFRSRQQQSWQSFRYEVAWYQGRIKVDSVRARIANKNVPGYLVRLFHWYTNGYYKRGK